MPKKYPGSTRRQYPIASESYLPTFFWIWLKINFLDNKCAKNSLNLQSLVSWQCPVETVAQHTL